MPTATPTSPGCTCVGPGRALSTYLLAFSGQDWRPQPLMKRQACLQALLERFGCPAISLSEPFEDGLALLCAAKAGGLVGVVSKRRDAPYRSGECWDWRKVKTVA
jgi:bifunctional non-homologous end joining protein LigD